MRHWVSSCCCLLALVLSVRGVVSPVAASAEQAASASAAKGPSTPKPPTHTVKKEPLKIDVSLDGVFEAQEMVEISVSPKSWTTLTVVSAVEHGALVGAGDRLMSLEMEKIDRAIEDLRLENEMSALALALAERELAALEKSTSMDLAAGERAEKEVREDLDYYFQTARPWTQRTVDFSLKSSEKYLTYQREELDQLEKMYKADDLTEETEDLILRRGRDDLERSEFSLEREKVQHDRMVGVSLPRQDADIKETAERFALSWAETKAALPLVLQRGRLELERQKSQRARSLERLEDLLADREAMIIKAPMAGLVYYGKCVRGRFSSSPSDNTLRPGGSIPPKQTFMTIVKPRPVFIRASVAERDLHAVRGGLKGTAVPTGYPDLKLAVIVDSVAAIPVGTTFDSRITVALGPEAEPLKPGMTCKLKIVSYEKKDAITVPPRCLQTDDEDEEKQYVYLLDEKEQPQKRGVTVGKRTSAKVEILDGLAEGDRVLLSPPKDEEPAAEKPTDEPKPADEAKSQEKPADEDQPADEAKPQEKPADEDKPADDAKQESPIESADATEEGA